VLFDSFEGLPIAQDKDGIAAKKWQEDKKSATYFDNCSADMSFSHEAMKLSGARQYKIIKGWFKDTLLSFKSSEPIAMLRIDGDWYDSTMQCLDNLYPRVNDGGIIIIDDYYTWDGCTRAIHDYLSRNELADRIRQTAEGICYLVKTKKS
jgi:O-methyltransferase